jgi:hypothetical protein
MWRHYFYVASLFLCGAIIFMWRHYFYVAPLFLFGLIIFVWRLRLPWEMGWRDLRNRKAVAARLRRSIQSRCSRDNHSEDRPTLVLDATALRLLHPLRLFSNQSH